MADPEEIAGLKFEPVEKEDPVAVAKEESTWLSWLGFSKQEPRFTKISDVPYPTIEGNTDKKHKLDIYVPTASPNEAPTTKRPVLIHIHGGGWVRGDKAHWFYGSPATGTAFASFNFLTVAVGYRTKVPFPGAINDVADAIAWIYQHIGEEAYGSGDVDRVFVSGHSAGGHLASLVTLDRRWLDQRNVPHNFIKGVASISGIYNVSDPLDSPLFSWGYRKMYIAPTFGSDLQVMADSSPLTHLMAIDTTQTHSVPPFLVLNAESDFGLQKDGRAFHSAFLAKNLPCDYLVLEKESHGTISRSTQTMMTARNFFVSLLANLSLTATL